MSTEAYVLETWVQTQSNATILSWTRNFILIAQYWLVQGAYLNVITQFTLNTV